MNLSNSQAFHFIQSPELHHLEPKLPADFQKIHSLLKSDPTLTLYDAVEELKARGYLRKGFEIPALTTAGLSEISQLLSGEWKQVCEMMVNIKGEARTLDGKAVLAGGKKKEPTINGHSLPRMICAAFNSVPIEDIIGIKWKDGNAKNNALENLIPITLEHFPDEKINLNREEADDGQFKPHYLYLTILSGSSESLVKIGVSKWTTDLRFQQEINYVPIRSHHFQFKNGIEARGWESLLKERVIPKDLKRVPCDSLIGGGKYECYDLSVYSSLLSFMKRNLPKSS